MVAFKSSTYPEKWISLTKRHYLLLSVGIFLVLWASYWKFCTFKFTISFLYKLHKIPKLSKSYNYNLILFYHVYFISFFQAQMGFHTNMTQDDFMAWQEKSPVCQSNSLWKLWVDSEINMQQSKQILLIDKRE